MQCKDLEAVLESEGLSPLPLEAREHLAACSHCQDLLADLSAIAVATKSLPSLVTPPDRIWVSIRAQLAAEGIIRDTIPAVAPASYSWHGLSQFFRPRALATVGAGLLVVFGSLYFAEHRGTPLQPAQTAHSPAAQVSQPRISPSVAAKPVFSAKSLPPAQSARVTALPSTSSPALRPSPSEEAYLGDSAAVLNETEGALRQRELSNNAAVDASLRQNLRTLDDFIAECEARLKQNPQDQLIREYLNSAYQQKAELLTAIMDSGRSEH